MSGALHRLPSTLSHWVDHLRPGLSCVPVAFSFVEQLRRALSYDPATGTLTWTDQAFECPQSAGRYAGKVAGSRCRSGHLRIVFDGKALGTHRVAWAIFYGVMPAQEIDHVNGIPSDNRIENLRLSSRFENMQNRAKAKSNSTGYKGVRRDKKKNSWRAKIGHNGQQLELGSFRSPAEAAVAYDSAAKRLHGRFARLNFPEVSL